MSTPIQGKAISLFGKPLTPVPPNPVANDGIIFNFATLQWELGQVGGGGEANTSSNVGPGAGLALPKVGVDLPFKSLLGNPEIVLTPTPTTVDFAIGAIAQSKITGLVAALLTKIETSSNVGSGLGLALLKVLNDLPFKSLVAGDNVTLTGSPTEIEIKSDNTFVMGYHSDKNWQAAPGAFGAMFTSKADETIEAEAQGFFNFGFTVREITVFVSNNIDITSSSITLKKNSVAIPATTITIPALTTGKFSISVTEAFGVADEIHDIHVSPTKGGVKNTSYYLECTRP